MQHGERGGCDGRDTAKVMNSVLVQCGGKFSMENTFMTVCEPSMKAFVARDSTENW